MKHASNQRSNGTNSPSSLHAAKIDDVDRRALVIAGVLACLIVVGWITL